MNEAEVSFLRGLMSARPESRRLGKISQSMAEGYKLGKIKGKSVVYDDQDFAHAQNLLSNRGHSLTVPMKGRRRSDATDAASEKTGARPVSEGLVAVVPLNMPMSVTLSPGQFIGMPWAQALAMPHEVMLVCENLEPILTLHEFQWLDAFVRGRPTLALFRGTLGTFNTAAAAKLIAADTRPTLAFFDFDPKGLSMAASLPRREALCLPAWVALETATQVMQRRHLFTNQLDSSATHLNKQTDPQIAEAWRRMRRLTLGLNQEGFPRAI